MVWCSTCQAMLCHGCDLNTHTGQTCNPKPHVREVLDSGKLLGPKDAAPNGSTGPIVDMPGVYLMCTATCPACGCHDWAPTGDAKARRLKVIGSSGPIDIDRVSFKCTSCTNVLLAGDPTQYLTKTTVPASLGSDTTTIFLRDFVLLMHSMQRANPGISATAIARALSLLSRSTVRPDHVQTVLNLCEDVDAALEVGPYMTDVATQVSQRGGQRLVGTDMSQKVPPPSPPLDVRLPTTTHTEYRTTTHTELWLSLALQLIAMEHGSTAHSCGIQHALGMSPSLHLTRVLLSPLFLPYGSDHALTGSAEQAANQERHRQE